MTDETPATGGISPSERDAMFRRARPQLRSLAHRLLGSAADADDMLQEAWIRLDRSDIDTIDNVDAWLRTVVTRLCLDELRSRRRRPVAAEPPAEAATAGESVAPEETAIVADSVTRAMLVVLDRLEPDERIAFVLHDLFAVPFADIGPIVDRSPATTKKPASRARSKVRGGPAGRAAAAHRSRSVVERFLSAAGRGDLAGVVAVLAPDVVRRSDVQALPPGAAALVRGADAVARGTVALAGRSEIAEVVLVDGSIGAIVAPAGRLWIALRFEVVEDRIAAYDVIADPARLAALELRVLDP